MRKEEEYQFNIYAKQYKELKPIAKKTKMVPCITKKEGMPFLMHKYRKRKGFFAGVLLCCVLIYIMSLYIWDINIEGGYKYTPEAVVKFLHENEVSTGMQKKKIDCQEIEDTIRLSYPDIGWVSAEIKGTRLIIKITETNMPAPAKEAIAPSHMIAAKDGIVKEIITRSGTPMVKDGDIVKKGDILVSGILTVIGDNDILLSKKPVIADADIKCKTYYDYKETFSMNYIEKVDTKESKKGYNITLFGKKIFLYNPRISYPKYDIIVSENALHLTNSFYLPFRFSTVLTKEYTERYKTYSESEANVIAKANLKRYFDRLIEKGVIITENNVKITIKNNYCSTMGRIIVEEAAWEYQTVQEDEWRIDQTDEHNGNNY